MHDSQLRFGGHGISVRVGDVTWLVLHPRSQLFWIVYDVYNFFVLVICGCRDHVVVVVLLL